MDNRFIKEFKNCTQNEGFVDLPEEIIERRLEFLFVVDELIHHKLTVAELNKTYIILAGLLLGKYPKIAAVVDKRDRIRLPFAALQQLPATKDKLNSQEKLLFAFCAFYSVCVEVFDEKTGQIRKGIYDIDSPQHAIQLLEWERKSHPEKFAFLSFRKQKTSSGKSIVENSDFGVNIDNPIKAISIANGYVYLNRMRMDDGMPIKYDRLGSVSGKKGNIIDSYVIHFEKNGTKQSVKIYIDPYATENSSEAPKGVLLEKSMIEKLTILAEQGDAKAQNELGYLYFNGKGVLQDDYEAFKWFQKAAQQGFSESYFYLGVLYSEGKVVPQDYSEALKWYKLSAETGESAAESNIGLMYSKGRGVKQDYAEAVSWYRKATEKGYALAQNNLGEMYANGRGVKQDMNEAIKGKIDRMELPKPVAEYFFKIKGIKKNTLLT